MGVVSSTVKDVSIRLGKSWAALKTMNKIRLPNLIDNIKRNFFRAAVESVLIYGSITWMLTKALEKQLHGDYT